MSRRVFGAAMMVSALMLAGCANFSTAGQSTTGVTVSASSPSGDVTLYVVRHGETVFNELSLIQGWSDSPLTAQGEELADEAGVALADHDFAGVYVSDLGRTRQTADHILAGLVDAPEPTYMPELREWNFGGLEGSPEDEAWDTVMSDHGYDWAEVQANLGSFAAEIGGQTEIADLIAESDPLGLAEDGDAIRTRLGDAFEDIVADAQANGGGDVLVVTHGLAIGSLLELLDPDGYELTHFDNLGLSVIEVADGQTTVLSTNDTDYLGTQSAS